MSLIINDTIFTAEFFYDLFKYILIPFLVGIVFSFIVLLLLDRYYSKKRESNEKDLDLKINSFLSEMFFSNLSSSELKQKISQFKTEIPFNTKWCKELVLYKIIELKQYVLSGDTNSILLLYKYFGFEKYSKFLLKSNKWYYKSLGIYHYQMLGYKIKKAHIRPLLKNKNAKLKSNALVALIILSDEKFDYLKDYKEPISTADELKILDIINKNESKPPVNVNNWLHNDNPSIVILGIKLIVLFKGDISEIQLKELLNSKNEKVRKATILAVKELKLARANQLIIEQYQNETLKENKLLSLKTLKFLGEDSSKNFVGPLLYSEIDLDIKFEIANCLNTLDSNYFEPLMVEPVTEENQILKNIVLHIKDPHLN